MKEYKLKESKSKHIDTIKTNREGDKYLIVGVVDKNPCVKYLIRFNEGTQLIVRESALYSGKIKNPNKRSVFDVGFIGKGIFKSTTKGSHTKEYTAWKGMLQRCYSSDFTDKNPTYKSCLVDSRWHNFQNFCEDIKLLEGYENWNNSDKRSGWDLDKDIKVDGNKMYSKETCVFATHKNNVRKAYGLEIID